jgi:hypothetical protein
MDPAMSYSVQEGHSCSGDEPKHQFCACNLMFYKSIFHLVTELLVLKILLRVCGLQSHCAQAADMLPTFVSVNRLKVEGRKL